jgi:hypothetical protein
LHHPRVFIGITNPEPAGGLRTGLAPHRDGSAGNPFSYDERRQILDLALQAEGVDPDAYSIVPFPLEHPGLWTAQIPVDALQYVRVFGPWEHKKVSLLGGAYDVQVTNDEPKHCEGSRVRAALTTGQIPERDLHPTTVAALRGLIEHRSYQDRIAR